MWQPGNTSSANSARPPRLPSGPLHLQKNTLYILAGLSTAGQPGGPLHLPLHERDYPPAVGGLAKLAKLVMPCQPGGN